MRPNPPTILRSFDVTLFMEPPTATHHSKKIVTIRPRGKKPITKLGDKDDLVRARERYRINLLLSGRRPSTPLDGPIRLDIVFVFPGSPVLDWHEVKPDRDNLEKTLVDVLAKSGWIRLDQRICAGEVQKLKGPKPFIRIVARELGKVRPGSAGSAQPGLFGQPLKERSGTPCSIQSGNA